MLRSCMYINDITDWRGIHVSVMYLSHVNDLTNLRWIPVSNDTLFGVVHVYLSYRVC